MRLVLPFAACLFSVIGGIQPAPGQAPDDAAVCAGILRQSRAGLYISYPSNGAPGTIRRVGQEPIPYDANARLYFVPGFGARLHSGRGEGVWHIRTQTRATAAPSANEAYVYRPPITTRCSPTVPLPAFSPDDRFVELNRYVDHHSAAPNARERDLGLRDFFHFRVQDAVVGCLASDDRAAFGDLEQHYGFESVARTQEALQRSLSVSRPAVALPLGAIDYAGLSSEFNYHDRPGPACLRFTVPLPTRTLRSWFFGPSRYELALRAAQEWRPLSSMVVIKRLRGRNVSQVLRRTINWVQ